jgi:hypothetical protein
MRIKKKKKKKNMTIAARSLRQGRMLMTTKLSKMTRAVRATRTQLV